MVAALPIALAVLTAGLYLRWPRAIPLLLIGSFLFPDQGVPIALDVATLSGLMLGILVDSLRHRDATALNSARTPIWVPFIAFAVVLVASAVANHTAYAGAEHASLVRDTKWFVFRMAGVPYQRDRGTAADGCSADLCTTVRALRIGGYRGGGRS